MGEHMLKMNEYLKIKQASEFLGLGISKMLKMDRDGILVAHRMPGSKFRLYTKEQLEKFLNSVQANS
jgi:excisionase family DNA binding protein